MTPQPTPPRCGLVVADRRVITWRCCQCRTIHIGSVRVCKCGHERCREAVG